MSIQSEIDRIETAKTDLKSAINDKGGALTTESIDEYADAVRNLPSGGTEDHNQLTNRDMAGQHPISAITGLQSALDGKGTYSKPTNGIPKTDLASSVQTSLGKADTAIQPADYSPTTKTSAMTQAVGKDADGKLWTAPGGGGGGSSTQWVLLGEYDLTQPEYQTEVIVINRYQGQPFTAKGFAVFGDGAKHNGNYFDIKWGGKQVQTTVAGIHAAVIIRRYANAVTALSYASNQYFTGTGLQSQSAWDHNASFNEAYVGQLELSPRYAQFTEGRIKVYGEIEV